MSSSEIGISVRWHRSSVRGSGAFAIASMITFALGCSSSEDKPPTPPAPPPGGAKTLDWKTLGYDLSSTYWNRAETKITKATARNLVKAWEFDAKGAAHGTAVISGGRVYVSGGPPDPNDPTKGGVIAIELATATEIWRNQVSATSSSLALDGEMLYMHDAGGWLRAFDINDGTELWAHQHETVGAVVGFSSPVVTGDLVLVGTSSAEELILQPGNPATFHGSVMAMNKSDGSLVWKKSVAGDGDGVGIWSTLSVDEDAGIIFAATGNNYTVASDTSDAFLAIPIDGGDFKWKTQILEGDVYTSRQSNGNPDADFGANPILFELEGRKVAAGGNKGGNVWVLDRMTGEVLKQRNLGPSNAARGGIFNNGAWDGSSLLFAVNGATSTDPRSEPASGLGATTLFALDPATLDIKWERQIQGPSFSPITVANGVGFVGKNKTLHAFDTATGDVLFELETEGTLCAAPAISDGYVVFGSGMQWGIGGATAGTKYYAMKVP